MGNMVLSMDSNLQEFDASLISAMCRTSSGRKGTPLQSNSSINRATWDDLKCATYLSKTTLAVNSFAVAVGVRRDGIGEYDYCHHRSYGGVLYRLIADLLDLTRTAAPG